MIQIIQMMEMIIIVVAVVMDCVYVSKMEQWKYAQYLF